MMFQYGSTLLGGHRFSRAIVLSICASIYYLPALADTAEFSNAKPPTLRNLSLANALQLTAKNSPIIQSTGYQLKTFEGLILQADTPPNPQLSFSVEEFLGSGSRKGLNAAEVSLSFAQTLQLGGKRSKAVASLEAQLSAAQIDVAINRIQLYKDLTKTFIQAVAAQALEAANRDIAVVAKENVVNVERRLKAGISNEAELAKSKISLARANINISIARRNKQMALQQLVAFWSNGATKIESVQAEFHKFTQPPELALMLNRLATSPLVAKMGNRQQAAQARLAAERSKRVPNLTIGAGVRYLNETGDAGLLTGVSLPLPIFDRNQGNIASAEYALRAASSKTNSAFFKQKAEITKYRALLGSLFEQLGELNHILIPQAEQAYQYSLSLYEKGRFGYLDLLDAQRTLYSQKVFQIQTLAEYHTAVAELEAILGVPLSQIN